MAAPTTGFPDLDGLLEAFVADVRIILDTRYVGAYLHGSFALGSADVDSDVDFVIVTTSDPVLDITARLQEMHARLFARKVAWAQHLEGSYIPIDRLRSVDPTRTEFLFLDNGARSLVRDAHCNTAVVRWILRERGITLDGPAIAGLVDPVAVPDLRREGIEAMHEYAAWGSGPMSDWKQTYLVVTACRILYTLETCEVASKKRSGEWALDRLDAGWSRLIRNALDRRADPWTRVHLPADPLAAERTRAFLAHATACADGYRSREEPLRHGS
jgi:predicted nucleotidyltransferase